MKKSLWMLGIAVLAVSACSNVDVVKEGTTQQARLIGFDTHINKSTRAVDNNNFSKFYVYGSYTTANASNTHYTVFSGIDPVTSTGGSKGAWTYQNPRYWIPGANYKFYACSNDNEAIPEGAGRVSFSNGKFEIVDYLCDGKPGHQKDLIFAGPVTTIGKESGNDIVSFNFKHILGRLNFIFKTTFSEDTRIVISNFKVNNIRNKGNFNEIQWENVDRDPKGATPTVNPLFANGANTAECVNDGGEETKSDFVYVIPFKYESANVDVIFDIAVKNGEGATILERTLKASWAPHWEMGKSYTYRITINGNAAGVDPIEFGVEDVSDWTEGSPTMPNITVDGGKQPQQS